MVMFINKETIQRFCQVGSVIYEIDKCCGIEPEDYKIIAHTVTKTEMDFCGMAMVQCGECCFFETEFGKKVYFTEEQAQNVLQTLRQMWKN